VWGRRDPRPLVPRVSYEGFLPTEDLQSAIGGMRGDRMEPKWVEAFGNFAIEAMATGVPRISYRAEALPDIVQGEDGVSEHDDVGRPDRRGRSDRRSCDRVECRQRVDRGVPRSGPTRRESRAAQMR